MMGLKKPVAVHVVKRRSCHGFFLSVIEGYNSSQFSTFDATDARKKKKKKLYSTPVAQPSYSENAVCASFSCVCARHRNLISKLLPLPRGGGGAPIAAIKNNVLRPRTRGTSRRTLEERRTIVA